MFPTMRIVRRANRDEGFMLVAVIGLMLVGAIIVAIMAAATMRSISSTTASRANLQSQTAAQTGVEFALSAFATDNAASACINGIISGTINGSSYRAELFPTADPAPLNNETAFGLSPSCPTNNHKSVFVRSTGSAAMTGVNDTSGDNVTVHALIQLKNSPEFSLDHAIFAGSNATLHNATSVLEDDAVGLPANIYAGGEDFVCHSGMRIEGSVFQRGGDNPQNGGFRIQNGSCYIVGDIVSNTLVQCAAGLRLGGDMISHRAIEFNNSDCYVGIGPDDVQAPGKGNISAGSYISATGGYRATGDVTTNNNYTQSNTEVNIGGTLSVLGSVSWEFGDPNWVNDPSNVGGGLQQLTGPAYIPPVPVQTLPVFDDAWIAESFEGWARPGWKETFEPVRNPGFSWFDVCSGDGGNDVMGTLVINQDTVLDIRDEPNCNNGRVKIGYGLTIELNANLAIIGNGIQKNAALTIVAGDQIGPGDPDPELYFIQPATGDGSCVSHGSDFVWSWGAHSQPDNRTRVLIYAPRGFSTSAPHKIRGQIYGCHVTLSEPQQVVYAPVTGIGGTDGSSGDQARIVYMKDAG